MPARMYSEPDSDATVEPENCRDRRKTHRVLALVPASLVAVAALAAPVDMDRHRGMIIGKPALAQDGDTSGDLEVMTLNQALGADLGPCSGRGRTRSMRPYWSFSKASQPPTFPRGRSVRPS